MVPDSHFGGGGLASPDSVTGHCLRLDGVRGLPFCDSDSGECCLTRQWRFGERGAESSCELHLDSAVRRQKGLVTAGIRIDRSSASILQSVLALRSAIEYGLVLVEL